MADYDDLVETLNYLIQHRLEAKFQFTRGLLGDGNGNVDVPDREGFSYVRPDRNSNKIFEMFNKQAYAADGTPILIGEIPWQPGLQQVLGVDWETYLTVGWDNRFAGLARHGDTHIWRDGFIGEDPFTIYRRQLFDLRTEPLGSGSTSVLVNPYEINDNGVRKSWPGSPGLDLSAAIPTVTGTRRHALVYWDYSGVGLYGSLGVVTGTLSPVASPTIPAKPVEPVGTIPSAFVQLEGGQAQVTEEHIRDARPFFAPSGSDGSKVSKVYHSDFDEVALQSDSDGNIGIDTAVPGARLEIRGSGSNQSYGLTIWQGNEDQRGLRIANLAYDAGEIGTYLYQDNSGNTHLNTSTAADALLFLHPDGGHVRVGVYEEPVHASFSLNFASTGTTPSDFSEGLYSKSAIFSHVETAGIFPGASGSSMTLQLVSNWAGQSAINFGEPATAFEGRIVYDHFTDKLHFHTDSTADQAVLDDVGNLEVAKNFIGQWYDFSLLDADEGSHFNDNDGSFPAGWTQTDAAATTNTNQQYGFWYLRGTSANTAYDYSKQTSQDADSGSRSQITFGPIMFRDGDYTADVDYYFGLYRDNSGIDTGTFNRVRLNWDSGGNQWRVRGEIYDGSTASESAWTNLTYPALQPLWFRCWFTPSGTDIVLRSYFGANKFGLTHTLLHQVSIPTGTVTWDSVWMRVHQDRGAGVEDFMLIGGVDKDSEP